MRSEKEIKDKLERAKDKYDSITKNSKIFSIVSEKILSQIYILEWVLEND